MKQYYTIRCVRGPSISQTNQGCERQEEGTKAAMEKFLFRVEVASLFHDKCLFSQYLLPDVIAHLTLQDT